MKVAVLTPYYKEEDEVLFRCIKSVIKQTHEDVFHVFIADGHPKDWIHEHHLIIPNTGDVGNTPRLMGSAYAFTQNADAIIFLDVDCWLEPDHVEKMVEAHRKSNAGIITCGRKLWDKSGNNFLGNDKESNGIGFNDTNCYMITKPYFHVTNRWGFLPKDVSYIGDRPFWDTCKRSGANIVRADTLVNYPTHHAFHFQMLGLPVPDDALTIIIKDGKVSRIAHKDVK